MRSQPAFLAILLPLLGLACAETTRITLLPRGTSTVAQHVGSGLDPTPDRTRLPAPGPSPKLKLPAPEYARLSNGMKLIVVERRTFPVVALHMVWKVGALEDPADRPGMAALCARMLKEGSGGLGPIELAEALDRLGARLETGAGWNATFVKMLTLSRHLDAALRLFAMVVSRPAFSKKDLARVKDETLVALRQRHDSPLSLADDLLGLALYGKDHRRGAPEAGLSSQVALLDTLDMGWWHRHRLRPDDGTLIVVGDVDAAALKAKLEAEFSSFQARKERKMAPQPGPAPPPAERLLAVELPGSSQTVVLVGLDGVPRAHPDHFPLLVANAILGGHFSSRLMMNLRALNGISNFATSRFHFDRDGGPFVVRAQVRAGATRKAIEEILKEIRGMRAAPPSDEELRQAKDFIVRSLLRRFETVEDVAEELAMIEIFSLPADYLSTFASRVEAVSAADVLGVAGRHLDPQRAAVVLVGEKQEIDKAKDLGLGAPSYRRLTP